MELNITIQACTAGISGDVIYCISCNSKAHSHSRISAGNSRVHMDSREIDKAETVGKIDIADRVILDLRETVEVSNESENSCITKASGSKAIAQCYILDRVILNKVTTACFNI